MKIPENALSSTTLMKCAGVTLRQLQCWEEQMMLVPVHSGHRRLYSPQLALVVMIVAELRRKGIRFDALRAAIPGINKMLTLKRKRLGYYFLLVVDDQGSIVMASHNEQMVLCALIQSVRPAWVIHIGELEARLPLRPMVDRG